MIDKLLRVSKAIAAAIASGGAAYATAIADGTVAGDEWATVVGAVAAGFIAVFFAPKNAEPA